MRVASTGCGDAGTAASMGEGEDVNKAGRQPAGSEGGNRRALRQTVTRRGLDWRVAPIASI